MNREALQLTDVHVHSACSMDCDVPMREMALAARAAGVGFLCFTDHSEMDNELTGFPLREGDAFCKAERLAAFAAAQAAVDGAVELRFGVELGNGHHDPARAAAITGAPELDFVIASVHNLRGKPDFYFGPELGLYPDLAQCVQLMHEYVLEHLELAQTGDFDVLGHLGYTVRYMKKAGFEPDILREAGELRELFRLLVERGKGIEVNTSGLRQGLGTTLPGREVLALYRACGGEVITLGSDAHAPQDIAADMVEARALLRALGFRYHAVFGERKPAFLSLDA